MTLSLAEKLKKEAQERPMPLLKATWTKQDQDSEKGWYQKLYERDSDSPAPWEKLDKQELYRTRQQTIRDLESTSHMLQRTKNALSWAEQRAQELAGRAQLAEEVCSAARSKISNFWI